MEEKREKEWNTERVVLVELLSVSDLSAHASPGTICSQPKWEAHKDNLTMFLLHFPPELNSIRLSLWQLIMMSILSYLLGSGWLLISGQHSIATLVFPLPRPQESTSLLFFTTVACFLLFIVWLPADSRQTTPDQCFWSGSVSTIYLLKNSKPVLVLVLEFCLLFKRECLFYTMFRVQTPVPPVEKSKAICF